MNFVRSMIWRWVHCSAGSEGAGWKPRDNQAKRLVEVKLAGIQGNGGGPGTCTLDVVLAEGRRIEVRRDFDAETLARLIRTLEEL